MIAIYGFLASDPDANHLRIFKLRSTPWLHVIYHVWLSVTDSGGYKYLLDTMRTKHVQHTLSPDVSGLHVTMSHSFFLFFFSFSNLF